MAVASVGESLESPGALCASRDGRLLFLPLVRLAERGAVRRFLHRRLDECIPVRDLCVVARRERAPAWRSRTTRRAPCPSSSRSDAGFRSEFSRRTGFESPGCPVPGLSKPRAPVGPRPELAACGFGEAVPSLALWVRGRRWLGVFAARAAMPRRRRARPPPRARLRRVAPTMRNRPLPRQAASRAASGPPSPSGASASGGAAFTSSPSVAESFGFLLLRRPILRRRSLLRIGRVLGKQRRTAAQLPQIIGPATPSVPVKRPRVAVESFHVGKVAHSRRRKRRKKPVCRAPKPRPRRGAKRATPQDKRNFRLTGKRRPPRCRPKKRRRRTQQPSSPTPIIVPAPPPPIPEPPHGVESPISVYSGPWGRAQAERLLWRAGFGPAPGWIEAYQAAGLKGAVESLTRPQGAPVLSGPAPVMGNPPEPIQPYDAYGHDHQWFLDRMVRSNQPLIERMTLIWHDWFATSDDGVGDPAQMLDQNATFRSHALGVVPRPSARHNLRPRDADVARRRPEQEGRDQRELRARGDGAVHARGRPWRLHRNGRTGTRKGALGLAGGHRKCAVRATSGFDPARFDSSVKVALRRRVRLRPEGRQLRLGGRRPALRRAPPPPLVRRGEAVELLHPDSATLR